MRSIRCSVAILLAVAAVAEAEENSLTHSLVLTASTPRVEISSRNATRNYLRLPSLEYAFQFTARCAGNFSPQSLSLSIADSRKSLSGEQLQNMTTEIAITMTVPAKQLAPLAIENFCIMPASDTDTMTLSSSKTIIIPAAFSAQASLLCVSEDQQAMIYASNSLDITLICNPGEEAIE